MFILTLDTNDFETAKKTLIELSKEYEYAILPNQPFTMMFDFLKIKNDGTLL